MIINEKTEPFKLESLKDWIKDAKSRVNIKIQSCARMLVMI